MASKAWNGGVSVQATYVNYKTECGVRLETTPPLGDDLYMAAGNIVVDALRQPDTSRKHELAIPSMDFTRGSRHFEIQALHRHNYGSFPRADDVPEHERALVEVVESTFRGVLKTMGIRVKN